MKSEGLIDQIHRAGRGRCRRHTKQAPRRAVTRVRQRATTGSAWIGTVRTRVRAVGTLFEAKACRSPAPNCPPVADSAEKAQQASRLARSLPGGGTKGVHHDLCRPYIRRRNPRSRRTRKRRSAAAGSSVAIDRRLRLANCPVPTLACVASGLTIACAKPAWQIFVPVQGLVSTAPIVRRGDTVAVAAAGPGFRVTIDCIAEADAGPGTRVRVRADAGSNSPRSFSPTAAS